MENPEGIKLSNGALMPAVGLGTWQSEPGEVGKAVEEALNAGYRHIDCAALYGNEKEIGEVLHKFFSTGKLKREDIFITSKLWNTDWARVRNGCEQTLKNLQITYLDLYLIHTPAAFEYHNENTWPTNANGSTILSQKTPVHVVWADMEKLQEAGLTKAIGISNFSCILINDMLCTAKIKPAIHQLEIHPYFSQKRNAEYCLSQGIQITAYSPLASGKDGPLGDSDVIEIAKKHNVSPAQVLIRWSVQHGYTVLPKSVTPERIRANFHVFHFHLSSEEMKLLDGKDRGLRTCDLANFWKWPVYD